MIHQIRDSSELFGKKSKKNDSFVYYFNLKIRFLLSVIFADLLIMFEKFFN